MRANGPARSFVTTEGKRLRLHPKVPYGQINQMVGALHIRTPDGDVADMIAERAKANAGWTAKLTAHAVAYALARHRVNQGLYARVMGGLY